MKRLLVLFAMLVAACGPSDQTPPEDDGIPVMMDFTGDEDPQATVPEDTPYDEVELPLPQVGEDSGQAGITYAAVLGGYYLMRTQLPSGRFNYQYNFKNDEWEMNRRSIRRQAVGAIAMANMTRLTGRPEFDLSTRRSLDYILSKGEVGDDGYFHVDHLGGTALASIATSVYVMYGEAGDEYEEDLNRLADYIMSRIGDDGWFTQGDHIFLGQGQTMMALEHLHAATGDEKYLDALEGAADWAVANAEEHNNWGKWLTLWANEPLTYLYSHRPKDGYAEGVFTSADRLMATQHPPGTAKDSSWDGGYEGDSSPRPLWSTGLRQETIIDAYRMAKLHGDEEREEKYAQSAKWASAFMLRLQIRKGEKPDIAEPDFVVGGWPFSDTSNLLRVDATAHTMQALMKTVEYLQLEAVPGGRSPDEIAP
jgi:hypothetical protein